MLQKVLLFYSAWSRLIVQKLCSLKHAVLGYSSLEWNWSSVWPIQPEPLISAFNIWKEGCSFFLGSRVAILFIPKIWLWKLCCDSSYLFISYNNYGKLSLSFGNLIRHSDHICLAQSVPINISLSESSRIQPPWVLSTYMGDCGITFKKKIADI